MVASASVGCDGRTFVPMRWKMRLAPITIPMPTTKAMAPTTIRPRKRTWASRPRGIKKLRTNPTIRTESGISGGKIMTFGVSREVSVMASFVAPGILQSEELRLLLRPNQFGSDPRQIIAHRATRCAQCRPPGRSTDGGERRSDLSAEIAHYSPEDRAVNVAACACSMSGQESKRDQKGTSESAKSGKSGTSSGASFPHNSFKRK